MRKKNTNILYISLSVSLLVVCSVCILNKYKNSKASCGAGAQSVSMNRTGCGFDPHSRKWKIYLYLYFHFFALVGTKPCLPRQASAALSSATQHFQKSAESEERSFLTLSYLWLDRECYVRVTEWSWFIFWINNKMCHKNCHKINTNKQTIMCDNRVPTLYNYLAMVSVIYHENRDLNN